MPNFPPAFQYDSDALTYINAVEAADGIPLETAVKRAMHNLIAGLKTDGEWTALSDLRIYAGPRTLAGCAVAAKGTNPTLTNFVAADLARAGGIIGDGSSKFVDHNVNANTLAQNSASMWTYITEMANINHTSSFMGNGRAGVTGSITFDTLNSPYTDIRFSCHDSTGSATAGGAVKGLMGMSRAASGSYTSRCAQADTTYTVTSQAARAGNLYSFKTNYTTPSWSDHRSAVEGFGAAATSLANIETRIATYLEELKLAIFDDDALTWANAVEAADGQGLEWEVKMAVNKLVHEMKKGGVWDSITDLRIYAGPRTLAGCAVALKGTAPTLNNFVSGDIARATGIVGNGSTKYVNHNVNNNTLSQNSNQIFTYMTATSSVNGSYMGRGKSGTTGSMKIGRTASGTQVTADMSGSTSNTNITLSTGLVLMARQSSSNWRFYANSTLNTITNGSGTPATGNIFSFCTNDSTGTTPAEYTDYRACIEGIGTPFTPTAASVLSQRCAALQTAISNFLTDLTNAGL